jgi:hypothetical protein
MSIEDTDAYVKMMEDLEAVWKDALKLHGCVECARVGLAQQIRLMARAADWDIVGDQGEDGDPVPEEHNGIRRTCPSCQTSPPEGAIRFFKHGTDELQ